mmetsp:Transcript_7473/g.15606  ORF Transcript_7473/g.15606 Transcript_7473/m.15606 type:complete len:119 (-) Transcript_7473:75-431(-)
MQDDSAFSSDIYTSRVDIIGRRKTYISTQQQPQKGREIFTNSGVQSRGACLENFASHFWDTSARERTSNYNDCAINVDNTVNRNLSIVQTKTNKQQMQHSTFQDSSFHYHSITSVDLQ